MPSMHSISLLHMVSYSALYQNKQHLVSLRTSYSPVRPLIRAITLHNEWSKVTMLYDSYKESMQLL